MCEILRLLCKDRKGWRVKEWPEVISFTRCVLAGSYKCYCRLPRCHAKATRVEEAHTIHRCAPLADIPEAPRGSSPKPCSQTAPPVPQYMDLLTNLRKETELNTSCVMPIIPKGTQRPRAVLHLPSMFRIPKHADIPQYDLSLTVCSATEPYYF